ncbi:hypothetical protein vseg_017752 [Gypsophila vaccaria]
MAKKKNKNNNNNNVVSGNNNKDYNNNNGSTNNEDNNDNSSNKNNDNNNDNNNNNNNTNNNNNSNNNNNNSGIGGDYLNIVLNVDLHCNGCTERIRKCILSFPGACTVEFEGENKLKIIALKNMDVWKLKESLEKKLMKNVELISPKPPKKDDQKKDIKTDKPKELPMTTVILKIPYHCHGCGEKTHKAVSSYKGVIEVNIDKEKDLVTVKGKVDGKQMVEDMKKKLKKTVELVPEKKNQKDKKDEGQNNGEKAGDGGGGKGGEKTVKIDYYSNGSVYGDGYQYGYGYSQPVGMMGTPQLFSDENPNACSIM